MAFCLNYEYNDRMDDQYTTPYEPMNIEIQKHSGFGIASFTASLTLGVLMLALIIVASVLESSSPGGMDEESPEAITIGLLIIGAILGQLLALILGIVGVAQSSHKRIFGVLGISISLITLFLTLSLIFIGLTMA